MFSAIQLLIKSEYVFHSAFGPSNYSYSFLPHKEIFTEHYFTQAEVYFTTGHHPSQQLYLLFLINPILEIITMINITLE